MVPVTNTKLASFADSFPIEAKDRVEKLASDIEKVTARKLDSLINEPVSTGTLRSSKSLKSTGKGLILGWESVRAVPIDMGRVKSKTYRRTLRSGKKTQPFSRLLGSDKAPEGFTQPAIKLLKASWNETVESAGKDF